MSAAFRAQWLSHDQHSLANLRLGLVSKWSITQLLLIIGPAGLSEQNGLFQSPVRHDVERDIS